MKPGPEQIFHAFKGWLQRNFVDLIRQMRWSYLPPLMVYFAAGVSGFTGIIESFFVKEHLGLSTTLLASIGFWAGLPWALKMPLGHLVDLFWRRKAVFVYSGAALMAASLLIMVGLTGYSKWMAAMLPVEIWYIISMMLAPVGFVFQDVVADAMTVEAVPTHRENGERIPESRLKQMHVTMQTLGRIAIVGGGALVAGAGGWFARMVSYEVMYWISLVIPAISVVGVSLGAWMQKRRSQQKASAGPKINAAREIRLHSDPKPKINWNILVGSAAFVILSITFGISGIPFKEEIIFIGSLSVIAFLMRQIFQDLDPVKRRDIMSIALIIFIFRAVPTAGAGVGWWQIDVLGFDETFFGTLRQAASILAIIGMLALRKWMGRKSIPYLVVFLSVYSAVMMSPFIGMYYGLHEWTQQHFGFGARTIAVIDTMADSPLGQVAMIPMLAWIAREAPRSQKATYFAVMAAFTNLALSASYLGTNHLNAIFAIERGRYDDLGALMITVAVAGLLLPILTVLLLHPTYLQKWKRGYRYVQQKIKDLSWNFGSRLQRRRIAPRN